jgi:fructose-1,6-bisphosphatase/inositol monophosphatase family enzyme
MASYDVASNVCRALRLGEMFTAVAGRGAHLNGAKISASDTRELGRGLDSCTIQLNLSRVPH